MPRKSTSSLEPSLTDRFEEIRAAHPDLGFALYGFDPGAPVIFEVITPEGETYKFRDLTFLGAINQAFPPDAPPAPAAPEPANDGSIFN